MKNQEMYTLKLMKTFLQQKCISDSECTWSDDKFFRQIAGHDEDSSKRWYILSLKRKTTNENKNFVMKRLEEFKP